METVQRLVASPPACWDRPLGALPKSVTTAEGQEFNNSPRACVNVGWRQPPKNSLMAPVKKSPEGRKSLSPNPAEAQPEAADVG